MLEDVDGESSGLTAQWNVKFSPRYLGTDPEPRPGLSSGHIPHSFSLPFNIFLQNNVAKNGSTYTTLLPEPQLRTAVIDTLGPDRAQSVFNGDIPVIASCGSGMTAAVLWLGLNLLGVKQISIYDEVGILSAHRSVF
jgi:thiosulfate/3-mercaptopyruvate sulfurtransferase